MGKGNVRTPCPPLLLLPCPICQSDPAWCGRPVWLECASCGLIVQAVGDRRVMIRRWNRLAGAVLALERIAALPRAMHLLPQQTPEGVLIDHAARIAREALQQ